MFYGSVRAVLGSTGASLSTRCEHLPALFPLLMIKTRHMHGTHMLCTRLRVRDLNLLMSTWSVAPHGWCRLHHLGVLSAWIFVLHLVHDYSSPRHVKESDERRRFIYVV